MSRNTETGRTACAPNTLYTHAPLLTQILHICCCSTDKRSGRAPICHGLALGHNKKRGKDKNIYEKGIYLAKLNVAKDKQKGKAKKNTRRGCSPRSGPLRGERSRLWLRPLNPPVPAASCPADVQSALPSPAGGRGQLQLTESAPCKNSAGEEHIERNEAWLKCMICLVF